MSICIWLLSISIIMVNISILKLSKRIERIELQIIEDEMIKDTIYIR